MRVAQKLDSKILGYMTVFEELTKVHPLEFMEWKEVFVFMVKPEDRGKAIGRQGQSIKRLSQLFKRKVKVVVCDEDPIVFVKNVFHPLEVSDVQCDDQFVSVKAKNSSDKAKMIGREGSTLKFVDGLMQKYHKRGVKVL